jgi:hypothetical protein
MRLEIRDQSGPICTILCVILYMILPYSWPHVDLEMDLPDTSKV